MRHAVSVWRAHATPGPSPRPPRRAPAHRRACLKGPARRSQGACWRTSRGIAPCRPRPGRRSGARPGGRARWTRAAASSSEVTALSRCRDMICAAVAVKCRGSSTVSTSVGGARAARTIRSSIPSLKRPRTRLSSSARSKRKWNPHGIAGTSPGHDRLPRPARAHTARWSSTMITTCGPSTAGCPHWWSSRGSTLRSGSWSNSREDTSAYSSASAANARLTSSSSTTGRAAASSMMSRSTALRVVPAASARASKYRL